MDISSLRGFGVAMITPFNSDGSVDFEALERITVHISEGADYLVVLGTTGETPTLTPQEMDDVLNTVVRSNYKQLPIVLGAGGNNTAELIKKIKAIDATKVDALLSVGPYYNRPTQEGHYQHFAAVSKASDLPIILYNIPGRTGANMTAETTVRLANDFDNIIGVKEASGDLNQMVHIIKESPDDFLVISADDGLTLALSAMGGDGVISVVGNAIPKTFGKLVHAALDGNVGLARDIHYQVMNIMDMLFVDGNPAGVKGLMSHMGLCKNKLRLPLMPATDATMKRLAVLLDEYRHAFPG